MNINYDKKKAIGISKYLILIGMVITLVGFGLTGFNFNKIKESGTHKWYHTLYIDGDSIGISIIK